MRTFLPGLVLVSSLGLSQSLTATPPASPSNTPAPAIANASAPTRASQGLRAPSAAWLKAWEDLEGRASWYSATDPGVVPVTANTETFNDRALTCAMWGVPFNTHLKVTNLENGRSVIVRVNDRGPAERLVVSEQRIIDLTKAAFSAIAEPGHGLIRVRVELAQPLLSSAH